MCGRKFNLPTLSWDVYQSNFALTTAAPQTNFAPNYNIAPTHEVPVIFNDNDHRHLRPMRWGLIPGWSKELKMKFSTFNARAEKLEDSPEKQFNSRVFQQYWAFIATEKSWQDPQSGPQLGVLFRVINAIN